MANYAVISTWNVPTTETNMSMLLQVIVPDVAKEPGFVLGRWTAPESEGGDSVDYTEYDNREAADQSVRNMTAGSGTPEAKAAGVTLVGVVVREVVASA